MNSRYRFEAHVMLITPLEVTADSEQEAREKILCQDLDVVVFDALHGEVELILKSVVED